VTLVSRRLMDPSPRDRAVGDSAHRLLPLSARD